MSMSKKVIFQRAKRAANLCTGRSTKTGFFSARSAPLTFVIKDQKSANFINTPILVLVLSFFNLKLTKSPASSGHGLVREN